MPKAGKSQAVAANITEPSVVIKIEQEWHSELTSDQLYERTRRYWKCDPERRKVPPRFAICVARGVIREVYRIDKWETYEDMSVEKLDPTRLKQRRSDADQKGQRRRGFIGVVAAESMRSMLIGKSIENVKFGFRSPLAYANCPLH